MALWDATTDSSGLHPMVTLHFMWFRKFCPTIVSEEPDIPTGVRIRHWIVSIFPNRHPTITCSTEHGSDYYAGIFRCNKLLQKLDGIDFSSDPAARPRIEGETRFLRALMYFDMVRLFERIPLLTEPDNGKSSAS